MTGDQAAIIPCRHAVKHASIFVLHTRTSVKVSSTWRKETLYNIDNAYTMVLSIATPTRASVWGKFKVEGEIFIDYQFCYQCFGIQGIFSQIILNNFKPAVPSENLFSLP
jgi:hypothetical protein